MIYKIKRKLKIAWELIGFKLKKIKSNTKVEVDIYQKPFLDAIKQEIEEKKR